MIKLKKVLQEDIEYITEADFVPWNEVNGKTLLVTGATGLIGSQLVYAADMYNDIHNGNITIYAVARNEEKAKRMFDGCSPYLHIIVADMTEDLSEKLPEGRLDYIVHTASVTSSRDFVEKPVETISSGINGTDLILRLARDRKCEKFIYLSSLEAYGVTDPALDSVRETDSGYINQLEVRSSYSEGKRMAECLCMSYASEYGVPVVVARLCQTFGAGVAYEDNRVFAQFARAVIEKKDIVLKTKGETYRNYCYTRDAAAALLLLLVKGTSREVYNVANFDTGISICDMAKLVCREFSDGESSVVFDIAEDAGKLGYGPTIKLRLNTEKIEKLGYVPSVDLTEMYGRMIQYFRENQ
jgi:nucleoside-diphosphate-sugar epimerase